MARKFPPDPPKKKTDPKPSGKVTRGTPAQLRRNKKGDLVATLDKNFGGVSKANLKESAKIKAGTGDGTFSGGPAPRVGGKQKLTAKSGPIMGGTKKQDRKSTRLNSSH